jgi:putative Mn2+ efflux pump MntP
MFLGFILALYIIDLVKFYMDITILLIALGLAMDSFSVSIANGLATRTFKPSKALTIALFFGFFQGLMPIFGWVAGESIADQISAFDHWVAFGLLTTIGIKMIYESIANKPPHFLKAYTLKVILFLSIATSIDALAVGLSFSFLDISILFPALMIGLITFMLSFLGVYVGKSFGKILKNRIEILGGLILIVIGLKILLEHTLL